MVTTPRMRARLAMLLPTTLPMARLAFAAALKVGYQADDQFGKTGAEGHDGQSDYDQRNVQTDGETTGAAHKKVGSAGQECEADKEE